MFCEGRPGCSMEERLAGQEVSQVLVLGSANALGDMKNFIYSHIYEEWRAVCTGSN